MTAGHKHRYIKVRYNSLVYRALRKPLIETTNLDWVNRSRMVFGPKPIKEHEHQHYTLSLLGILHGLFGLTIRTQGRGDAPDPMRLKGPHTQHCREQFGFNPSTGRYCCDTYAAWFNWTDGT
jgi:hypothetical protein